MKTIAEIRLDNLAKLIKEHGTQDRVAELGETSSIYLSQIKNQTPDAKSKKLRQMGDEMARKLELGCGKPIGWMDNVHKETAAEPVTYIKPTEDNQIVTNVLIKAPPEQAYQNLVRAAKDKCYPLTVDAQFYQNTTSGDVSFISQFDAVNRIVWVTFAIKPHSEGAAVSMAYRGRKNEFIEPSIKWLNGQDAKCPVS